MSLHECSRPFNCTKGCPNFQAAMDEYPERGGVCRKNPPQGVLMQDPRTGGTGMQPIWPPVGPKDWCAEHPQEQQRRRNRQAALPDLTAIDFTTLSNIGASGGGVNKVEALAPSEPLE